MEIQTFVLKDILIYRHNKNLHHSGNHFSRNNKAPLSLTWGTHFFKILFYASMMICTKRFLKNCSLKIIMSYSWLFCYFSQRNLFQIETGILISHISYFFIGSTITVVKCNMSYVRTVRLKFMSFMYYDLLTCRCM